MLAPAAGASPSARPSSTAERLRRPPGLTPDVWQGPGVDPDADDQWDNDANWSLGIAPLHLSNPYVCIPAGGLPVIRAGQDAQLVALDVAADAVLHGRRRRQALPLRRCADTVDDPRARGGRRCHARRPGRVDVSGTLHAAQPRTVEPGNPHHARVRLLPGPYPPGEAPCVPGLPIVGATGRIVVDDDGVVDVSGGRVNLGDQYQLQVHGLLRVHDDGFLAADHGTRLELLPHSGPPRAPARSGSRTTATTSRATTTSVSPQLSTVVNQGQIIKSGGTGTSLVTGAYSQPSPGAVTVGSGTLLLPSGSPTPASVTGGAGVRIGALSGAAAARLPGADVRPRPAERPVPRADGGQYRRVGPDPGARPPRRRRSTSALPVEAHATGLSATAAAPAILSLRYDERILGGRDWTSINVFRRGDGAPYVALQPCLPNGDPPGGQVACVDRRGLAGSSRNVVDEEGPGNAPDVIMVVRTLDTSRWVAR